MKKTPIQPAVDECWLHEIHGWVMIMGTWAENESVCRLLQGSDKKRRMLLRHELLLARIEMVEGTFEDLEQERPCKIRIRSKKHDFVFEEENL